MPQRSDRLDVRLVAAADERDQTGDPAGLDVAGQDLVQPVQP